MTADKRVMEEKHKLCRPRICIKRLDDNDGPRKTAINQKIAKRRSC